MVLSFVIFAAPLPILWKEIVQDILQKFTFCKEILSEIVVVKTEYIFFVWIVPFYKDITLLFTGNNEDEWICIVKMANVFYNYPKKAWKASEGLLKRSKTVVISIYVL